MSGEVKPSWLWVVLFGLLALFHLSAALHHPGARAGDWLMAAGFLGIAIAALRGASGFLQVTWQQFRSPRTITARQYMGLAGAAMLVIGAAVGLLQI